MKYLIFLEFFFTRVIQYSTSTIRLRGIFKLLRFFPRLTSKNRRSSYFLQRRWSDFSFVVMRSFTLPPLATLFTGCARPLLHSWGRRCILTKPLQVHSAGVLYSVTGLAILSPESDDLCGGAVFPSDFD